MNFPYLSPFLVMSDNVQHILFNLLLNWKKYTHELESERSSTRVGGEERNEEGWVGENETERKIPKFSG